MRYLTIAIGIIFILVFLALAFTMIGAGIISSGKPIEQWAIETTNTSVSTTVIPNKTIEELVFTCERGDFILEYFYIEFTDTKNAVYKFCTKIMYNKNSDRENLIRKEINWMVVEYLNETLSAEEVKIYAEQENRF